MRIANSNNGFCFAVETAVGHQDVAVWIESEEVAEDLDSGDCAGNGIVLGDRLLGKDLLLSPWLPISMAARFGGQFKKTFVASIALCLPLTVNKTDLRYIRVN